ncbi:glycosyltransferase [Clostridium beijerinckii]|uniref:glycosyltransferase n=1 Tax=Clostridium beijerinckii TaxID=1520 RepID=UPI0022DF555F|nr:glycosyltransferase [Clostridium beijerinckii]
MKNCLVLLTKVFPFDKGEEFIEGEIKMLSEAFEKVIVIATSVADDAIQTRNIPSNFEVHKIKASKIKHSLPISAVKLFPFYNYNGCVDKEERNAISGSIKKKAYLTYFTAKANSVLKEVLEIIKKYNMDEYSGITLYSYWLYDIAFVAIKLKELYGKKITRVVSRTHRYDLYANENSMNYIPLRHYFLRNLDAVYPCSDDGSNYLKKLYPDYSAKIKTAYLGTKDYGTSQGSKDSTYRIVSCCHVSPVKRIDLLTKSLVTLKDSGLNLKWTHFGAGDGLDEIKEYARENLDFMDTSFPGSVKNSELMEYYKNEPVDLFINTSSSEGLPVSIMEACSFSIPTIATNVGGTAEIVKEGETGLLLDKDFDPEELGNKIKYMAEISEEEKQKFRDRCRSLWTENFCADSNFRKFAHEIRAVQ